MRDLPVRNVARVVLIDGVGNVLLVRYEDETPMDPDGAGSLTYWVPPGGAARQDESLIDAAARELKEETGQAPGIGSLLWQTRHMLRFKGRLVDQSESYFLAQSSMVAPAVSNRTSEAIVEHRWWALDELEQSAERFFPDRLVQLLPSILEGEIPPAPIRI